MAQDARTGSLFNGRQNVINYKAFSLIKWKYFRHVFGLPLSCLNICRSNTGGYRLPHYVCLVRVHSIALIKWIIMIIIEDINYLVWRTDDKSEPMSPQQRRSWICFEQMYQRPNAVVVEERSQNLDSIDTIRNMGPSFHSSKINGLVCGSSSEQDQATRMNLD